MKYGGLIAFFALFTVQAHTAESISCDDADKELAENYKEYLRQKIEEYKSAPIDLDELINMGAIITGKELKYYTRDTQNKDGDTLLHIAVKKDDLSIIKAIFAFSSTMHKNLQGKKPFDIALEKLDPENNLPKNYVQITILETIAQRIADKGYFADEKISCLEKIIALELACKSQPSADFNFCPSVSLLKDLIPNKENSDEFLADCYRSAFDKKTKDTFAHIYVYQENPDELYKLVCQNRASKEKNEKGLDALECALQSFREFAKNPSTIDINNDRFKRVRCCYFIMRNYYTEKTKYFCCEKHTWSKD